MASFKAILRIVKWFFTKNVEFCTTMHIRWALNSIITLFLVTRVDSSHRAFYYALRSQRVATTVWNDSPVVQSVERRTVNPYVTGSSPVRGAIFFFVLISILCFFSLLAKLFFSVLFLSKYSYTVSSLLNKFMSIFTQIAVFKYSWLKLILFELTKI